ncbi:MAG: acetyl-CoA carboxylase biotin carboxylase subunit [Stappiaceae bacterium]
MELTGKTLFIANRGEIAVRINRAAKALGMEVVQAYSEADAEMLAVRLADRAVEIGPPQAAKSYLDADRLIEAAEQSGADAVHPGYGFLSENADFANAVEQAGLIFVGPTAETIALMGDKAAARAAAQKAGTPVAAGSDGRVESPEDARAVAARIGFPLMIKAAAGGGGRGIRIAHNQDELDSLVPQARSEAQAAFGDGGLYIEQLIENARHVEVQILGDGTRAVHLFERECSLQRRRQKVWEEAPADCLSEKARQEICASSVSLAESVSYRGAGTLEYLFDPVRETFAFLEMNTRVQVEHPVTELVTGVDIVQEMIRVAFGAQLSLSQDSIALSGHAIEVRVNAEDPMNNFMPFPGIVGTMRVPEDVRFDTMLYEGYAIPPFYDSLLGKLIVHGANRAEALESLRTALETMQIDGVKTTLPLYKMLAANADVSAGEFHTRFLEGWIENHLSSAG